ncbi:MAG: cell division protein ZapE [Pseudomonadota bacterium]|nr:cell division protein ZapE [Pseudomonadota bacterium]
MSDPMLPSQRYAAGVARGEWLHDPAQLPALAELDRIHAAVTAPAPARGLFERMFGGDAPASIAGLYLWGGVGCGKTFLIDLFHAGLPIKGKRRTHFHRFMREVHAGLREHAGEADPLAAIARQWRASLQVLVLDEFFVSDIGDAMLLGRLLEHLFAEGIVLVTSSNAAPSQLYMDGLQRVRFLPAIALIEGRCQVVHLDSQEDYRLRALSRSALYRAPLDAQSDDWLQERWRDLGADDAHRDAGIEIDGRRIPVRARVNGMCWFDFVALCEGPRGSADYIEVAREFHTVLVGGIPRMDGDRDDAARRFVHLVDELYDRHVNLVCTADAEPSALYTGERLVAAFERTASRLIEMRSAEYLALEHRS